MSGQLGTQGVSAVGWAGQRWWRGLHRVRRQGREKRKEVVSSLGSEGPWPEASAQSPEERNWEKPPRTQPPRPGPGGPCREGARQNHGGRPTRSLRSSAPGEPVQNPCGCEALEQAPRELGRKDWELWAPPTQQSAFYVYIAPPGVHSHVCALLSHPYPQVLGRLSFSL